ncbi:MULTISPECIES: glycosyltransferase [unclassified Microbacterium]|uniref:glycosyltransferase n=1 Tax=unclassified Microbacterium TaxID=2609290 RepID=UPI0037465DA2
MSALGRSLPEGEALRIAVIAPSRHPIRQPYPGGLEASVWERVRGLRARGHSVTLCGPEGSDFLTGPRQFVLPRPKWGTIAEASDTAYPDGYLELIERSMGVAMAYLARNRRRFDIVDNHSLHGTPLSWSDRIGLPMVTTLHTPPLPAMLAAQRGIVGDRHRFHAVSRHTAGEWADVGVDATVFPNGVDTERWAPGHGGDRWTWFGRIVPEKAPHLAIDAARLAGRKIVVAGRVGDAEYFATEIEPRLGSHARYVGPLRQSALARLVGRSAVVLVTPMWEEPFGLVLAEALATGTPVAAFDAGGVREVIGGLPGTEVVPRGDVVSLSLAADELAARAEYPAYRAEIRAAAALQFSLDRRHDDLERLMWSWVGDEQRMAVA